MDVVLNSAMAPYLIIPLPAGYPMVGFLPGIQMMSVLILMFLIRQQAIMPDGHPLKFTKRTTRLIYTGMPTLSFLEIWGLMIYMLVNDDQPAARKLYQERYPFFRRFFDLPSLYVFTPDIGGIMILNLSTFFFFTVAVITGICTVCFVVLTGQKQFMSPKTYRLQKLWIYNCIIQHGFCSSVVTLLIYKPYSEYVKQSALSIIAFITPYGIFGRPATSVRATSATINRSFTATIHR
ncbi:unnamed protein product, partial [Mesorhabditis spiculigera]